MNHYGKAPLIAFLRSARTVILFIPGMYWLMEWDLPGVFALLFAEAEFDPHDKPPGQSLLEKRVLHEVLSSSLPGEVLLGSGENAFHEKPTPEYPSRSSKMAFKERNTLPAPNYEKDEKLWMTIDGRVGSYVVFIHSGGEWDSTEQQWKYQVRQTDGVLYEGGRLVAERNLHWTEK